MFSAGARYYSFSQLVDDLMDKNNYIWMYGKPVHPGFVTSLQLRTLYNTFSRGGISYAIKNPDVDKSAKCSLKSKKRDMPYLDPKKSFPGKFKKMKE